MRKRVGFLALASTCLLLTSLAWPRMDEDMELRKNYPFGLLGSGYGIVTGDDLAQNAKNAEPVPFSPHSTSYPYWQCFSAERVSFVCDDTGYDEDEKSVMAILAIVIDQGDHDEEYLSRRSIEALACKRFQTELQKAIVGERHVCVSGPFSSYGSNDSGKKVTFWIFDKLKTRKGCVSYFEGACRGDG